MHGLLVIVLVLKYQHIGGPCRLFNGMGLARSCGTGLPAMCTWTTAASAPQAPCVPPFLSNLVSNIVQEMGHMRHHMK